MTGQIKEWIFKVLFVCYKIIAVKNVGVYMSAFYEFKLLFFCQIWVIIKSAILKYFQVWVWFTGVSLVYSLLNIFHFVN